MFDNEEQGSQGNKLKEKNSQIYFSNHFLCDLYDRNNKLARVK